MPDPNNPFSYIMSPLDLLHGSSRADMRQNMQMDRDRAEAERLRLIQQQQLQQASGARGVLLNKVGQLVNQGLPPNKILTTLLNDEDYITAFSDPNTDVPTLNKLVTDMISGSQAPKPEMVNVPPGGAIASIDPNTNAVTETYSRPTEAIQTFKGLAGIANFTPEQ